MTDSPEEFRVQAALLHNGDVVYTSRRFSTFEEAKLLRSEIYSFAANVGFAYVMANYVRLSIQTSMPPVRSPPILAMPTMPPREDGGQL